MKISKFTRFTAYLLVAGFFYSCSSSQVSIDSLIADNKYQQAINEINNRLSEDPSQPLLYIQRAKINATLAQDVDPELRNDLYQNVASDFSSAIDYQATDIQLEHIDSLSQQYWKFEHNAGLQISENESLSNRYQRAKIHFQNALFLRQDAVSSYKNLAIAEFNLGEIDPAIQHLQEALQFATDEQSSDIYENLGYLHLEKGEPDKAADLYERAGTNILEDRNLAFGLINAYISNQDYEKAAGLLDSLVQQNPDNANLRNVYGTQLYEITTDIMDDLEIAYSENDTLLANQILFEAEGMGDEAENQLIEAFRRDTSNTDYIQSLAVFYNNLSAKYLEIIPIAFDSDKEQLDRKAYTLINFATEYYQKLVKIDPNNETYTSRLKVLERLQERRNSSIDN